VSGPSVPTAVYAPGCAEPSARWRGAVAGPAALCPPCLRGERSSWATPAPASCGGCGGRENVARPRRAGQGQPDAATGILHAAAALRSIL